MADAPAAFTEKAGLGQRLFFRFVWSRKTLTAVALVSPTVLATVGGLALSSSIERRLEQLSQRRDKAAGEIRSLDQLVVEFQSRELLRTSFLVQLKASNAEDGLKFGIDQLYRESAHGTLRRLTAVLYPAEWQDRSKAYDDLLRSRYDNLDAVQKLTSIENDQIVTALGRITEDQAVVNDLSHSIDGLSRWKSAAQIVLIGLTNALSLLVFLYKADREA